VAAILPSKAEAIAAWNTRTQSAAQNVPVLLEALRRILPSAAGLDDAPDSKIIACYMNMGELRAIKAAIAQAQEPE